MKRRGVKVSILISVSLFLFIACENKGDDLFEEVKRISQTGYDERELSEQSIEELKQKIEQYREKVNQKVEAYGNLGVYYKMLAVRYIDAEMYELALESLEKAIRIYPENKILFYFAGVSAGRTAKSRMDEAEKRRLLVLAEKYYRRALDLDAQYVEALYGLSVLYVFEMDKVMEAEPLLNRILEIRPNHYDAMFLLARVYVTTGRVEDAVELYDKIGEESGSKTMRQKARENKQQLLEGAYEF